VGRGWGVQIIDKRGMAVIMTFKIPDKIVDGTLFKQRDLLGYLVVDMRVMLK
jgi:hypothetical protein